MRTTSFWLGLCSSLVVLASSVSSVFGVEISSSKIEGVVLSICALLICFGFVTKKTEGGKDESTEELLSDIGQKDDVDN